MGNFPNKNTQFSSENQPKKNGRKKKIYTILVNKGYSADDIKTAFGELAFYTVPELHKVYENNDNPVIARIVANQFYQALKKSDWTRIREILEHVIGKPEQKISQFNDEPPRIKKVNIHVINHEQGD